MVQAKSKTKKKVVNQKPEEKRVYFKQADFPQVTLHQAQRIASVLVDTSPGTLALHRTLRWR